MLLGLVLGATGWLWIGYWARRRQALESEEPRPPISWISVALLILTVGIATLLVFGALANRWPRATLIAEKVPLRALPSEEGVSLSELRGGVQIEILREKDEWIQVRPPQGGSGWLQNKDVLRTSR
jgi:SH3-like domain-containing protein